MCSAFSTRAVVGAARQRRVPLLRGPGAACTELCPALQRAGACLALSWVRLEVPGSSSICVQGVYMAVLSSAEKHVIASLCVVLLAKFTVKRNPDLSLNTFPYAAGSFQFP